MSNVDKIISGPQRTVQNIKKAGHDPLKLLYKHSVVYNDNAVS